MIRRSFLYVVCLLVAQGLAAQLSQQFVSFDDLPTMISSESVTVGSATFSGGIVRSFSNVPSNPSQHYYSAGPVYPGDPTTAVCAACSQSITMTFAEPVSNLSFTLMNGLNIPEAVRYRYYLTTDTGQSGYIELGAFVANSFSAFPFTIVMTPSWTNIRTLTITPPVATVVGGLPWWSFSIDNIQFTPQPTQRQRIVAIDLTDPANPVRQEIGISINVPRARFPLGAHFLLRHQKETAPDVWQDADSDFVVGTQGVKKPLSLHTLFPDHVVVPFTSSPSQAESRFVATHRGEVQISVVPKGPEPLHAQQVRVVVEVPLLLGSVSGTMPAGEDQIRTFDGRLIEYSHRAGVPPQYTKSIAYHESGRAFNRKAYAYEPIFDRERVQPRLQTHPYEDYRLATSQGLSVGVNLCRNDTGQSSTGCLIPDLDDVSARDRYWQSVNCGPPQAIVDGATARQIVEGNPRAGFRVASICGSRTGTGRPRPILHPDPYEFTAQTPLASSYGVMQILWSTAIETKWTGHTQRLNPALLFDTQENVDRDQGSIPVGTMYMVRSFHNGNVGVSNTNPSIKDYSAYQDLLYNMLRRYNGMGTAAIDYANLVSTYPPYFLPQRRNTDIFGRSECEPIAITAASTTRMLSPGETAWLGIVTDDIPSSITWYEGRIGDTTTVLATGATYAFPVTPPTSQQYWVAVTSSCGRSTQASFVVEVQAPCRKPSIVSEPTDVSGFAGQFATLRVETSGPVVVYDWYQGILSDTPSDGRGAPVASNSTGELPVLVPDGTASYWVVARNECGAVTSRRVLVSGTVCHPPVITSPPQDETVVEGEDATLAIETANSTSIQWYEGVAGDRRAPISGATGTSVTVSPSTSHSYWVDVIGLCGSASASATVTVLSCTPTITMQPSDASTSEGHTIMLSVVASVDTGALSYEWLQRSEDTLVWSPVPDSNASDLHVALAAGRTYFKVRVDGTCGSVESEQATVIVVAACDPPTILTEPPSEISLQRGQYAEIGVQATGSEPLSYQWYELIYSFHAIYWWPVAGATSPALAVTAPTNGYDGYYYIEVTNPCGVVTSSLTRVPYVDGSPETFVATYTVAQNGSRYLDDTEVAVTSRTKVKGHPKQGDRVRAIVDRRRDRMPEAVWIERVRE